MNRNNPTNTHGFPSINVAITSIVGATAYCIDNMGKTYQLSVFNMVGSGSLPQVGEQWTIDRTIVGYYTFQCRTVPNPPVATTTTESLLAALVATGLVRQAAGVVGATGKSVSTGYCFNS